MEKPKPPSPLRVLTRPSSAATATATATATSSTTTSVTSSSSSSTNPLDLPLSFLIHPSSISSTVTPSSSSSSSSTTLSSLSQPRTSEGGVVVVGFIGRRQDDVTQLMNRILDCNVFGSRFGNLDQSFPTTQQSQRNLEVEDWFRSRRISYYYEEEKEIVFLQFVSTRCPIKKNLSSDSSLGFDSMLEEQDFGDLQGMLLMFSVCHVIIYLQEGSHFDTQLLRKFRLLQAAKHALVPFMKSHIKPTLNSRVSTSSTSQPNVSAISSTTSSSSSGRGGRVITRPSSAISLMSGLGSYSSLFPGQCTPVVLFVFLDDFPEGTNQGSNVEDSTEAAPLNQSLNLSSVPRPGLPLKASSSVVVLSRPVSKSEGDFRKKLQSSLEAQIRFLIKKCRTLAGSDVSHAGSRPGGSSGLAPLFSLEATKAVALLDRYSNRKGESLDHALGLLDDILNGKATPDTLLLESHCQGGHKEDMQSIKEFIYKQTDTLRGRGGMVTNTNGGSAAGVGMVAVAAAAAAASAASGKPLSTPELPSLDNWLSSSRLILDALLSVRSGCPDESEITQISKRKPVRGNAVSIQAEKIVPGGVDPLQSAISWLESGKDLNMKFSTSWCQRALPAAKELYLKDLPSCYPTFLHEAQLEKALCAFRSSVKGPAVHSCIKKLEDECTSIWRSGRQLCDAVSLTGKPCAHQRHNIEVDETVSGAEVKPHSSGFVFLHACSCGRSRRLRDDPFDFETANITFSCFDDCDKLLPALQLPEVSIPGPIKAASWSLRRVGGARYYEPSKGLLQSGFCPTEKFLVKWTILLEMQTQECNTTVGTVQEGFEIRPNQDSKVEFVAAEEITQTGAALSYPGEAPVGGLENQRISLENISSDGREISPGRVIPHFTMKKPFSEVVAGSLATDVAFPPVRQRKQHTETSEKSMKHRVGGDRSDEQFRLTRDYQGSQKLEDISSVQEISNEVEANSQTNSNPFLQIASNVVPVSMNVGGKSKSNTVLKPVIVYFGFEHECSYGHRFLLTSEHLNELGSLYALPEESLIQSSTNKNAAEMLNLSKDLAHETVYPHANAAISNSVNKVIPTRSNQIAPSSSQHWDRLTQFCGPGKEHNQPSSELSASRSVEGLEEVLQCTTLDDDDGHAFSLLNRHAFSLLNRHLPIYMNCPHCKISNNKKRHQEFKFASTVSQLQRIFLVTPSFPVVLETCPVVQFEASCLPPSVPDCERQSQFSIGCPAILPPDSFITLRLPFVYGVQLEDGSPHPLRHLEHQPELTAWIAKGTVLQVRTTVDEYCCAASEGGLQYRERLLNQGVDNFLGGLKVMVHLLNGDSQVLIVAVSHGVNHKVYSGGCSTQHSSIVFSVALMMMTIQWRVFHSIDNNEMIDVARSYWTIEFGYTTEQIRKLRYVNPLIEASSEHNNQCDL